MFNNKKRMRKKIEEKIINVSRGKNVPYELKEDKPPIMSITDSFSGTSFYRIEFTTRYNHKVVACLNLQEDNHLLICITFKEETYIAHKDEIQELGDNLYDYFPNVTIEYSVLLWNDETKLYSYETFVEIEEIVRKQTKIVIITSKWINSLISEELLRILGGMATYDKYKFQKVLEINNSNSYLVLSDDKIPEDRFEILSDILKTEKLNGNKMKERLKGEYFILVEVFSKSL